MTDLLEQLADLPTPLVLLVAGVMAFSETGIGLGFFVPGETGVLVMATTVDSPGSFAAMAGVVWLSAAAGDSFGYLVGRRYGSRVPETRLGRRLGEEKWERSQELLRRYGARSVVTSRFLPAVRVLTPVAAGAAHLGYPRFVAASLTGALAWSLAHVAIGATAGASLKAIDEAIGIGSWVLLGVVVVAVAVVVVVRRRRRG